MDKLDKLKDIKQIEIIPVDFSIYFIAISIGIILFSIVLYLSMRKKIKKLTKKQIAKQYLKQLDFDKLSSKQIAYDFTLYGYDCVEEHYKDEFQKIVSQLAPYKYKKDVPQIDFDLIDQMKDYIKVRV